MRGGGAQGHLGQTRENSLPSVECKKGDVEVYQREKARESFDFAGLLKVEVDGLEPTTFTLPV